MPVSSLLINQFPFAPTIGVAPAGPRRLFNQSLSEPEKPCSLAISKADLPGSPFKIPAPASAS